jgi:hypothetical protein
LSLTKQEALDMLESDDLLGIGMAAHQMRLKKTATSITQIFALNIARSVLSTGH